MAFILLIVGIFLVVTAVRDTYTQLFQVVSGDFALNQTGGGFVYWIAALLLIGAVGYIDKLKPISDGLLLLVIIALILTKGNPKAPGGGFFSQLTGALGGQGSSSVGSTIGNVLGNVPPITSIPGIS